MFKIQQIDHIELFVPDQYEAARWYEQLFGLKIIPEFVDWADGGPLMISLDGTGQTGKLALFQGEPSATPLGFQRVAFGVDGANFMRFLARLDEIEVWDHRGRRVTRDLIVDHDKSWSIYFNDPFGHRYEVTSYDYDEITQWLKQVS